MTTNPRPQLQLAQDTPNRRVKFSLSLSPPATEGHDLNHNYRRAPYQYHCHGDATESLSSFSRFNTLLLTSSTSLLHYSTRFNFPSNSTVSDSASSLSATCLAYFVQSRDLTFPRSAVLTLRSAPGASTSGKSSSILRTYDESSPALPSVGLCRHHPTLGCQSSARLAQHPTCL